MIEKKQNSFAEQKAVLCGLVYKEQTEDLVNEYLVELQFLAETAGANTYKKFIQKLPYPDSKTFMGKGKLEEIKKYCAANKIDIVIFDDELNINNDNFDEVLSVAEIKPIICQKTVCPCSTEARLTKEL